MNTYTKQLEKLGRSLDKLLVELTAVDERTLHKAPIEGAWTPLQTLHHIYLTERASVDYLLYKFGLDDDPPAQNLRTRLNGALTLAVLASPKKFDSPEKLDSRNIAAPRALKLDALAYDLRLCRNELTSLLETAPKSWSEKAVFSHLVFGHMGVKDMLRFFQMHQYRHGRQIKRALAQNARNNRRQKAR